MSVREMGPFCSAMSVDARRLDGERGAYKVSHDQTRSHEPWPVSPEHRVIRNEVAQQAIEQEESAQDPEHIRDAYTTSFRFPLDLTVFGDGRSLLRA